MVDPMTRSLPAATGVAATRSAATGAVTRKPKTPQPIFEAVKAKGGGDFFRELSNMAARGDNISALLPRGPLPKGKPGYSPFVGAPETSSAELDIGAYLRKTKNGE